MKESAGKNENIQVEVLNNVEFAAPVSANKNLQL